MSWGDVQFEKPQAGGLTAALHRAVAPSYIVGRVLFVYVAVVIPCVSFAMAWNDPITSPTWQSGLDAKLSYTLTGRIGYVFFPLLVYATTCLMLVLFWRARFAKHFLIRGGVYSGVLIGLHFSFVFTVVVTESGTWMAGVASMPFLAFFALCVGGIGVAILHSVIILFGLARDLVKWKWLLAGAAALAVLGILAVIGLALANELETLAAPFFIVFFFSLLCGPFWYLAAFVYASWDIGREYWDRGQFRIWHLFFVFTWLGGYLAACRAAMEMALVEYQKLPTTPPDDCYVASTAARGHRKVVKSTRLTLADGRTMLVNRQLQILKYGEIALWTFAPQVHQTLRASYDSVGPHLAKRLACPLLADLAYFSLKPLEWTTVIVLRALSPTYGEQLAGIYRGIPTSAPPPCSAQTDAELASQPGLHHREQK